MQVLERRAQSADHPLLLGMPETHYLKCFILRAA
jgi:23S rRNA (cytosine1962-C5)-methyltransferase